MAKKARRISSGMAECVKAPMSRGGLEGYSEGEEYAFDKILLANGRTKIYLRPSTESPDYREGCGLRLFAQHFRVTREQGE